MDRSVLRLGDFDAQSHVIPGELRPMSRINRLDWD